MRSQAARNPGSATKTRNLRRLLHAYMEEAAKSDLAGVGDRIRQARQEAGLTQDELSDLIGVGMRQVQYYESGESNPYRTLRRIAEATGKSVGWLLHGDPVTEPAEGAEILALVHRVLEELRALRDALEQLESRPTPESTPREHGSSS